MRCSGPPSLYKMRMGGTASLLPYLFIKTFTISVALRKADNGLVAVILIPTQALPWYHDFFIDSGILLIRMTVGIKKWLKNRDHLLEKLHCGQQALVYLVELQLRES